MLIRFASLISAAGLSSFGVRKIFFGSLVSATMISVLVWQASGIAAIGIAAGIGMLGFIYETIDRRIRVRRKAIASAWPQVVDSLSTASMSGLSIVEAVWELGELAPEVLRPYFLAIRQRIDFGTSFSDALESFKVELSDHRVDRMVVLIQIVLQAGGQGFAEALRRQAVLAREGLALSGELEAKQGWVGGTAKLALVTPWLIVGLLCVREENRAAYSSGLGFGVLSLGLVISVFAYRIVRVIGRPHPTVRVFK